MISGFDSPVAVNADSSFCHPKSLYDQLRKKVSTYTLAGIQEIRIDSNWHDKAAPYFLEMIRKRADIATHLIRTFDCSVYVFVFSESDTASHHFWVHHDPNSPRRGNLADTHASVILRTYQALDAAVRKMIDAIGSNANVFVISDHGFGGTGSRAFSINRLLALKGFFRFRSKVDSPKVPRHGYHVLNWIPVGLQEMLFRKFGGTVPAWFEGRQRLISADLRHCAAFSDELNYFPSIWIHDDRFPLGKKMRSTERDCLIEDIIRTTTQYSDPATGKRIIRACHRREELYSGRAVETFPDLILELNLDDGYGCPVTRSDRPGKPLFDIHPENLIGHKGGSMNGSHRSHGVFFASGPDIKKSAICDPGLEDLAPTLLALSGIEKPAYVDGRILRELMVTPPSAPSAGKGTDLHSLTTLPEPEGYNNQENETVRKRLHDLGYL